jgi:hypothetical protein
MKGQDSRIAFERKAGMFCNEFLAQHPMCAAGEGDKIPHELILNDAPRLCIGERESLGQKLEPSGLKNELFV